MSVTGVGGAEKEAILRQVDRLIASDVLHGSESLCKLLRYLAAHSIDHPGEGIKEYQIATEVFKRPSDFDPRMDSTVRVQTGRLRSKLGEYYSHAGSEDHWIVEIPKGSYSLSFHQRIAAVEPLPFHLPESPPPANVSRPSYALIAVSALLALSLLALAVVLIDRASGKPAADPPPAALVSFWHNFVDGPEEPLVVFSNAEFVGRPETGMHYFNSQIDKPQAILDHYTGVGEVLGMHELDRVFTSLHHLLRVKRGRLLSMDDAKNNDLIFFGSPSENLVLRDMPRNDFLFKRVEDGPRKGDLALVNTRPGNGEAIQYLSSAQLPLAEDYAIVALLPGLTPGHNVMILAGLTTLGTQAAVEYVSRQNTVEGLLSRISGSPAGKVAPFEGVIQVKVTGGVPVHSELVVFHRK